MLLHRFDLELGWHLGCELHRLLGAAGECSRLKALLDPAIVAFANATAGSGYCLSGPELLLSSFDLQHVAWAAAFDGSDLRWNPYSQVLEGWTDCLPEISSGLGLDASRQWWITSEELEGRLNSGGQRLVEAIDLVDTWSFELRRFLRALGRIDLVAGPDGYFPTPRNARSFPRAGPAIGLVSSEATPLAADTEPRRCEPDQAASASPCWDSTEAAALLRTSVKSLYGLVERGAINPLRGPRRRYRFTPEMIAEYLKRERGGLMNAEVCVLEDGRRVRFSLRGGLATRTIWWSFAGLTESRESDRPGKAASNELVTPPSWLSGKPTHRLLRQSLRSAPTWDEAVAQMVRHAQASKLRPNTIEQVRNRRQASEERLPRCGGTSGCYARNGEGIQGEALGSGEVGQNSGRKHR